MTKLTAEQRELFDNTVNSPIFQEVITGTLFTVTGTSLSDNASEDNPARRAYAVIEPMLLEIAGHVLATPIDAPDITDGWRPKFATASSTSLTKWGFPQMARRVLIDLRDLDLVDMVLVFAEKEATGKVLFFSLIATASCLVQALRMQQVGLDPDLLRMRPEERAAQLVAARRFTHGS